MLYIDSEEIEQGKNLGAAASRVDGDPRARRFRRARDRGQDQGDRSMRARRTSLTSESAWACSSRSIEYARNVCGTRRTRTPPSSSPKAEKTSSTSWSRKRASPTRAARCAWALTPARFSPKHGGKPTRAYHGLRQGADLRAPSPSLRGFQRVPSEARREGTARLAASTWTRRRRRAGRDGRDPGPSLVPGLPVPSGASQQAAASRIRSFKRSSKRLKKPRQAQRALRRL